MNFTAPTDRALILALHHPIYSFDAFHSGSSKMADVLENAIRDTGRVPNLVLAGHVHDYQRIEMGIAPGGPTPFVAAGNGGYHNLHQIHSADGTVAPDTGAKLVYGKVAWGYLALMIDKRTISGQSVEIDRAGAATPGIALATRRTDHSKESEERTNAVKMACKWRCEADVNGPVTLM